MTTERPRLWLDCETSSLDDDRRAWEVAAILRPAGGSRLDDVEFSWFVDIDDLDLPQFGDPVSLNIGGFWSRHPQAALVPLTGRLEGVAFDGRVLPPAPVFSEREVLERVAELTADRAVVHGSNPAFDIMTLGPRMSVYGIKPGWHYHPEDVPSTARGWLLGRGHVKPPAKSDQISLACGLDPAGYGRHEALGDCRWLRDLSDLIERPTAVPAPGDETRCHRCGGPNVIWSAPSPLWNEVMRGGSIANKDEYDGIVCPTCFAVLARERGVAELWRFHAERVNVELETVTPSGRMWNERTWKWLDPHAHACPSCSPDGVTPGSGCHNCRRTGMDQTPCRAEGHVPQCPHGCCGGPRTSGSAVAWPQGATDA